MQKTLIFSCLIALCFAHCSPTPKHQNTPTTLMNKQHITPPIAPVIPYVHDIHGDQRPDDYFWMRLSDEQKLADTPDAHTQKVLDYLHAENAYREEMMSHTTELQEQLYEEIKGRIKEDDMSVPFKENGYWYITRFEKGLEYPIYSRKKETLEAAEEILLDVNELAKPYSYYNIGGLSVSRNNELMVYSEDTLSRRQYSLKVKNLLNNTLLPDVIPQTTGSAVWSADNRFFFYAKQDKTLRSFQIFRHELGTPASQDVMIYHEKEEAFSVYIYLTKSKKYLVIASSSTLSNEYRILEANNPTGTFKIFHPRERLLEYAIDHKGDQWYITTNKDGATNFKVMVTPEHATHISHWKDIIPHKKDVLIEGIDLFDQFIALDEKHDGISKIRIHHLNKDKSYYIPFAEQAYTANLSTNRDIHTQTVRISYTSLTTPSSVYDYDVETGHMELKKQQEVPGGFNPSDYTSERVMVKARDGVMVPMSIVYRKGFKKDGSGPLLLYGYGSYGVSIDPYFSSARLSLLDRGFAFAIAHIRGGQEMGRQWYEDGKFLKKKNTFFDFIDCGDYLVNNKYTSSSMLFGMGGSAGGLLIGAVINERPDLFKGVIAAVPFVDVVTTMLDESIPLTTGEFDEWGNPKDETYYHYMKSYSPYDNVRAVHYPAMLVTTGYHDSQVQYWEPAKWVAKLRVMKTDTHPLLMYCNMETGHGGASGRFRRFKETAMEYAFLLDLAQATSLP